MKQSKKIKKRKLKELLAQKSTSVMAYDQDLGTHGIKVVNNWDRPKSISTFKVTKTENRRRTLRQVRTSHRWHHGIIRVKINKN